jgi:hypothetical protein
MLLNALLDMTDDDLVASIATLAGHARGATAALVAHLAEMERRGLHLALGFRSLYVYCRSVLHLSEHESYNRMEAARVARRFPVVLPMLAEGLLHLTAVSLLGPRLGDENHLALLGGAIHKSKREVEVLLARWFPKVEAAPSVRKLPIRSDAARAGGAEAEAAGSSDGASSSDAAGSSDADRSSDADDPSPAGGPAPAAREGDVLTLSSPGGMQAATSRTVAVTPPRRSELMPIAADRYQVKFTASEAMIERLRQAQDLLSHSVPSGDVAAIFDEALIALLDKAARRKHAATNRSRDGRAPASSSRTIPAAVEREVWARDGGHCAFLGTGGRRCQERRFIEFHHVKPWVVGGPPTSENISLRCRAHNAYEAAVYFGPIRAARGEMELS